MSNEIKKQPKVITYEKPTKEEIDLLKPNTIEKPQQLIEIMKNKAYPENQIIAQQQLKFIVDFLDENKNNKKLCYDMVFPMLNLKYKYKITLKQIDGIMFNHYRKNTNRLTVIDTHKLIAKIYNSYGSAHIKFKINSKYDKEKNKELFYISLYVDKGYEIHHIDYNENMTAFDYSNNLICIPIEIHKRIHKMNYKPSRAEIIKMVEQYHQ